MACPLSAVHDQVPGFTGHARTCKGNALSCEVRVVGDGAIGPLDDSERRGEGGRMARFQPDGDRMGRGVVDCRIVRVCVDLAGQVGSDVIDGIAVLHLGCFEGHATQGDPPGLVLDRIAGQGDVGAGPSDGGQAGLIRGAGDGAACLGTEPHGGEVEGEGAAITVETDRVPGNRGGVLLAGIVDLGGQVAGNIRGRRQGGFINIAIDIDRPGLVAPHRAAQGDIGICEGHTVGGHAPGHGGAVCRQLGKTVEPEPVGQADGQGITGGIGILDGEIVVVVCGAVGGIMLGQKPLEAVNHVRQAG